MTVRTTIMVCVALALPLAGCGKPTLALSDDPVTRAAQCGVVATAAARTAQTDVKADLPFATQVEVLHYALLAATDGKGSYDQSRSVDVVKALPAAEPAITKGKWQDLAPACDAAFPEAKAPATLPATPLDAQLGCALLADYVEGALQSQETKYAADLQPVRQMRLGLDGRIGARLARAGATEREEQEGPRGKAMDAIVHAGAAPAVLDACVARFPGAG